MQSRWLIFAVFLLAIVPFASAALSDNLLREYRFDGTDDGTMVDSQGNSDGTYTGSLALNGVAGKALNGTGLFSDAADLVFNESTSFTISFWFSTTETDGSFWGELISHNSNQGGWNSRPGLYLYALGTSGIGGGGETYDVINDMYGPTIENWDDTTAVMNTGWHNIVLQWNGTELIQYIDGSLSWAETPAPGTFYFAVNDAASWTLNGVADSFLLDDVGVWSRALSSSEITDLQTSHPDGSELNPPSIIRPSNPIVNYTENIEFWSDLSEGTGVPDNLVAPGSVTASLVNTTWAASVKPAAFSNSLLIGTQSGDIGLVMNATRFDDWNDDFSMRGVCFWVRKTGTQENGWFQYKNATRNETFIANLNGATVNARWNGISSANSINLVTQTSNVWYHDCVMLNYFEGGYSVSNDTMAGVAFSWQNGVYSEGTNFGDYDGWASPSTQWTTYLRPVGLQTPSGTMAFGSAFGFANGADKYIAQPIVFNFKHGFTPTNFQDQVQCLYNGGNGRNYTDFINTCRLFNIKNVTLTDNGSALVGNYFLISAKGITDQSTYKWFVNETEVVGETNHFLPNSQWSASDTVALQITPATEAETGDVMNISYPFAFNGFTGLTNVTEKSPGVFEGYLPVAYQSVYTANMGINASVPNLEQTLAYWVAYRGTEGPLYGSPFAMTRDFNGLWYYYGGQVPFGYYNKTNSPSPPPYNFNQGENLFLDISSLTMEVYLRDTKTNTILKKTLILKADPTTIKTYPIINSTMYGYQTTAYTSSSVNITGDDLVNLAGTNYLAMPLTHSWGYLISPERMGYAGPQGGASHGVLSGTVGNITGSPCISVDQECLYFNGAGNMSVASILNPSGAYSAWGPNMFVTWVYPTNGSATTNQTIISNTGTNAGYFWLRLNGLTPEFRVHNDAFIVSNVSLPLNQWSLLAATYNGAVRSIYVNGQMTANGSGTAVSGAASTRPVIVGSQASGVNPFYGYIDEFYFFPVRSPSYAQPNVNSMLARIYNNGTGNFVMNGFGYEKVSPTNTGNTNYTAVAIISSIKMEPGQVTGSATNKVRLASFPYTLRKVGEVYLYFSISGNVANNLNFNLRSSSYNATTCINKSYDYTPLLGPAKMNATNDVFCNAAAWENFSIGMFENPCNILSNGTTQCSNTNIAWFTFSAPIVSFTTSMDSVCQQLVYPNEKDLPAPQQIQYNFTVDVTPSYDAESYVTYIQRAGQAAITPTCSYTGAGLQRNYTCNATMNYYTKPGLYTIYVNFTNGGLSTAHQNSDVCSYGQLLAMQKTTPGLTFAGAGPGINNIQSSNVITLENTGNVDFTMFLTGKDLTGRTSPSVKLPASAFKVGKTLGSTVALLNNVAENTTIFIPAGFGSNDSIYLWLSMPANTLPQDYYSQDSWEIAGQS